MKVKFKEIANFVAGQSPKSEYYSEHEGTPFLQGNRTFGTFYPQIDTYTKKVTKMANKNDILMSVRAPVGDLNFAPEDLCIGRGLAAITAKDGDNAFLFYALKYNINNLLKQSNGTTYDSVTGDIVKEMDMIIPEDKNVCKKISKLLFSIDSKIENNKQTISELESMAKTIYDYWFLQYEFPNEDGKPYKSSGGKMVWNEELKKQIPEGFLVEKILNSCDVVDCLHSKKPDYCFEDEKYYLLTLENLKYDGNIELLNKFYISKIDYENWTSRIEVKENDFVVTNAGRAGDICKIPKDIKCAIGRNITAIRPKTINPYYLRQFFKSNYIKQQIQSNLDCGSFFMSFNVKSIKQILILKPNEKIYNIFNEKIEKYILKIEKCGKENEKLTKLRDYLLPLLMNGQVGFKK